MCLFVSAAILKANLEPKRKMTAGKISVKVQLHTLSVSNPSGWSLDQVRLAQSMVYNSLLHKPSRLAPRPSPKPCNTTSGLLLHLIPIMAGDLEQNPGPGTSSGSFPCTQCHQNVTWSAEALQCDGCDKWLHINCIGLSQNEYNRLGQTTTCWICADCGLMNISTSLFRSTHVSIENSFDSLSYLMDSTTHDSSSQILGSMTSPGAPIHSSSPMKQQNKQTNTKKRKQLKVIIVNCQSLKAKREPFHHMIDCLKPDVVIGTESWLNEAIKDQENFPVSDYQVKR